MAKRKRERCDIESADGAKPKRVKEQSEDPSKAIKHQNSTDVVSKVPEDARSALNAEDPTVPLKQQEPRLDRRGRKKAVDLKAEEKGGLHTGHSVAKAPKSTQSAADVDPSNKAFRRQEAKRKRREISRLEDESGLKYNTEKTVNEVLDQSSLGRKARKKGHKDKSSAWKVSEAAGGQMLDLDPLFSQNEEYLLLAYDSAIHVYSISTSLLVRKLRISRIDSITAFTFSSKNSSHLYVSTRSGLIEKWDWIAGVKLEYWNTSSPIYYIVASNLSADDENNELMFTIDRKGEGPWMITAHRLLGGPDAANTDLGTLRKYPQSLTSLKVFENGRIIVATSGSYLMIGTTEKPNTTPLRDVSYIWREVECPEWITSIDVQIKHADKSSKRTKLAKTTAQSAVNIVVGGLKGSIFIYDDLLRKLKDAERNSKSDKAVNIISQRKHWHRKAVLSVKWSLDGNYVISGGLETVLQIWQLETGQKQPLPHLSAPVEGIVVSPSGSLYGIRLADNSAMILSTSELQPTFSVSGVQIPTTRSAGTTLPHLPTIDAPSANWAQVQSLRFPAAVGSAKAGQLLLAVPSSTGSRQILTSKHSAVYLQTFDIGSSQQVSRQALTRTSVTDVNVGPESNIIEEPNVTSLQISSDGQWLVTVDEWMPPKRDLAVLAFDKEKAVEEQTCRLEVYLKFWSWNDQPKMWELVSRIDNPHTSQYDNSFAHGVVLDLAPDPSGLGFSTVGDDGIVRIWKPSIRTRNGLEVRDKDGKSLMSWKCRHSVSLQASESAAAIRSRAKIAYSPDGSILAAGPEISQSSSIHIIDTVDGSLRGIKTSMYNGPLLGLGIMDRYLITLSHELRIFDLVNEQLSFGFALHHYGFSLGKQITMTHLAVDYHHGTFAVALPELGTSKGMTKMRAQVIIFDPADPAPISSTSLPNTITSLLPAKGQKGYHVIDSVAEIRTLTPNRSLATELMKMSNINHAPSRGLRDIYGNGTTVETIQNSTSDDEGPMVSKLSNVTLQLPEEDAVVVSQDRLAKVFDVGPAYALPPMTELFEQVASLFTKRPGS